MNQSHYPLRVNVGFLFGQSVGTYRNFEFNFPQLKLSEDLEVVDFNGIAHISRVQQGLFVQGDFSAQVSAQCARCLASLLQPIHTEFEELYAFQERNMDDSMLLIPHDGYIDLGPLVREYLLVEIPISPLCKPDCKGLCSVCGENLNLVTCEHVHAAEPGSH